MRAFLLTVSTMVLIWGSWLFWGRQRGVPPPATPPQPAQSNTQPRFITHNSIPRWAKEQLEAAMKPSREAYRRARALLAQGDLAGAEAECRKAVALSPTVNTPTVKDAPINLPAVQLLGEIYLRRGKNREALPCFLGAQPHKVGAG